MGGRAWAGIALLLLGAFLVRVGAAVCWQQALVSPHHFFFPDSHSYWHLARTIAQGEPYQYGSPDARVFRMPGYPAVLAIVFWLGGPEVPVVWGRMLGAALGIVPVWACWYVGGRLFGSWAGWVAGLVAAFYPEAVAHSIFILSEAAFCPLLGVQLVVLVLAWQSESVRKAVGYSLATGVVGGLGTLVRPSWLGFTPLVAFGTLICLRGPGRKKPAPQQTPRRDVSIPSSLPKKLPTEGAGWAVRLGMAGGMLVGMLLPLVPWWIRNYRLIGRFVPTTLQVGASLYDGLHPAATGKSDMRFVEEFVRSERWLLHYRGPKVKIFDKEKCKEGKISGDGDQEVAEHPLPSGAGEEVAWEYWLDRAMLEEACRWAKRHPLKVLRLAWWKLLRMWNPWPNEPTLAASAWAAVVGGSYLLVVVGGILGLIRGSREAKNACFLLVLPAVYLTGIHCMVVSSVRYRGPAMFGWIVLAAGWLAETFRPARLRVGPGSDQRLSCPETFAAEKLIGDQG